MAFKFEDAYPGSKAFLELPLLRIPSGWRIEMNELSSRMESDRCMLGSVLFYATNASRRFNIEVSVWPEQDPAAAFFLTVTYAPWPRTERGRRIKDVPLTFLDGEIVHESRTESYTSMIAELQHWIARCTVWTREGN